MKSNVVDIWSAIFKFLGYLSTFALIRRVFPSLSGSYIFVESWVFFNLSLSISVLILKEFKVLAEILSAFLLIYGVVRVFEIVVYQINVLMFDQYRAEKAGKKYELRSYRRLMILSIQNYIEILFWFSSFYFYYSECFSNTDLLNTAIGSFYYSLVTMSTLGYGDVSPVVTVGYLIVIAHTSIGVFLTLMIIARFISLLPKPETMDSYEKDNKASKPFSPEVKIEVESEQEKRPPQKNLWADISDKSS
uniref:Ion channel n=1 Tax=Candidatus Kentrum sp. FW TaxID=2126338 RepID=A0A450TST3_9GAMM|nr:MAG: Ion channel [Candidatus Kentron sp. FW]